MVHWEKNQYMFCSFIYELLFINLVIVIAAVTWQNMKTFSSLLQTVAYMRP